MAVPEKSPGPVRRRANNNLRITVRVRTQDSEVTVTLRLQRRRPRRPSPSRLTASQVVPVLRSDTRAIRANGGAGRASSQQVADQQRDTRSVPSAANTSMRRGPTAEGSASAAPLAGPSPPAFPLPLAIPVLMAMQMPMPMPPPALLPRNSPSQSACATSNPVPTENAERITESMSLPSTLIPRMVTSGVGVLQGSASLREMSGVADAYRTHLRAFQQGQATTVEMVGGHMNHPGESRLGNDDP